MASDDLNAPLGLAKLKRKQWPFSGPQMLAGAMTGCGFVVVCWAVLVNEQEESFKIKDLERKIFLREIFRRPG